MKPVIVSDAHHAWLVAEAERRGCTPDEVLSAIVEVEAYVGTPPELRVRDMVAGALPLLLLGSLVAFVVWLGVPQW